MMTITTEEAERFARWCDTDGFTERAAALRALAAERDMWRGENVKKTTACEQMGARIQAFEAENARLRAALEGIEEYWNGAAKSAVDAAEECRDRARAALGEKE